MIELAQYTSVRFGETLALSGLVAWIGTVGDAFDALPETPVALYKTEAVRDDLPFRRGSLNRLTDVELLSAEWVHWYNTDRLMHRLGRIPPEYETVHYSTDTARSEAAEHQPVCNKPASNPMPLTLASWQFRAF